MALTPKQESKYYVYCLADPKDGSVFYVGKGCGDRIHHHVRDARKGRVANAPKFKKIQEIISRGDSVEELILVNGLSERVAYYYERVLIEQMADSGLTNLANGCASNDERTETLILHNIKVIESNRHRPLSYVRADIADYIKRVHGSQSAFCDSLIAEFNEVLQIIRSGVKHV